MSDTEYEYEDEYEDDDEDNVEYENINFEIVVNESDNTVYVKFAGFTDIKSADEFADSLIHLLPLITHESDVKH